MKILLKIMLILLICQHNCFADISDIESEYAKQMKTAESSWQMKTFTINSTASLEKETKNINNQLINYLTPKQSQILEKNNSLWQQYLKASNLSTIDYLYKQQGSIYQDFALAIINLQAFTKATMTSYLLPDSKFISYNSIPNSLSSCIENSKNNFEICKCYDNESYKYKQNIRKNLNILQQKTNKEDYKKILFTNYSWEQYKNHTEQLLFEIIDSQKNITDKKLKKAQILFLLHLCHSSELSDINFTN